MRLIDADSLFEDCLFSSLEFELGLKEFINDALTIDAVPVVRCKDCKYYDSWMPDCDFHEWYRAAPTENDYCSRGERRNDV